MIQKQIIAKLIVGILFCIPVFSTMAQQSKVDSIVHLLQKYKTNKGLDTLTFYDARELIRNTVLTDFNISRIENSAEVLKKGTDEDLFYIIKYAILSSLTTSDNSRAIDYGRENLEKLESSKTPRSQVLRIGFLWELRLPYRNSNRLPEGFQFYT